jgi:O-antigen/teichoic acid export membrane protein
MSGVAPLDDAPLPRLETPPAHDRGTASIKGAALWAAASQYCLFVLQFVTSVVISRFFLQPEEVGLFSVALAGSMLFAVLQDFGLTRYLGAHPTADEDVVKSALVVAVLFAVALAALILGLAWPIAAFYGEVELAPILALIAGSYLLVPFSLIPLALLSRRLEFRKTFAVNIAGAIAGSGTALGLAAAGFSAASLAWAMIANNLVRAVVAQVARPTPLGWPIKVSGLKEMIGFGSASSLLYLSGSIGVRSPDLILGRALGMAATGLYSRGAALASHAHQLVTGAVGSIYYPAFARLKADGEALGPYYERVAAAHGAIVWPAMGLIAVLAEPIVLALYGPTWGGAAPILTLIALSEFAFTALPLTMDLPILLGRIKRLLAFNLIDTALSVGTLVIAATWGLVEAAGSRLVYSLLWFLLYAFWLQKMVGFRWSAMLKNYGMSLLLTAATVAPAALAVFVWRTPATLGFAGLLAAGAAAAVCWLAAIAVIGHPARDDLVALARHAWAPLRAKLQPKLAQP